MLHKEAKEKTESAPIWNGANSMRELRREAFEQYHHAPSGEAKTACAAVALLADIALSLDLLASDRASIGRDY